MFEALPQRVDLQVGRDESACARSILSTLARRAYRRPVSDADLKPLVEFYEQGHTERGFEGGIEFALRRLLPRAMMEKITAAQLGLK